MNIIETSRTILRKFTTDDLDDVAAILSNPRVMKYLGHNCQPLLRDETREILESMIKFWQNKGYGRLAIISKKNNKLIGMAGLRYFEGDAELFYLLDESFWGKGLATETAKTIVEYGFETFDLPRIIAIARPANKATFRVLNKLGLKFENEDEIQGARLQIHRHTERFSIKKYDNGAMPGKIQSGCRINIRFLKRRESKPPLPLSTNQTENFDLFPQTK